METHNKIRVNYGKTRKTRPKVKEEHEAVMMVILPPAGDGADDDDDVKVKKTAVISDGGGGGGSSKTVATAGTKSCQADKCGADLMEAKVYHRRHKVCEYHAKAQAALVSGFPQRFCQQCSRFHEISEFDDTKRSCRRRLAGHNERRRKTSADSHAVEGTSRKGTGPAHLKELVCGQQVDGSSGRIQISIHDSATYKHFQIR